MSLRFHIRALLRGGRAASSRQRFFNLPCFDPFINVVDPLAEPTHDIYTLAIAARLITRPIGAEFRGLLAPGDPGVIVGESH